MARRDVVVVGASFGGVETLQQLVSGLPETLPAAVFVVQHLPADAPSLLPQILTRVGTLPAEHARDMHPVQPGRIYVAPPDRHLTLEAEFMRVTRGPKVNSQRPAVDVLFRSAAAAFRERTVGVVLTGALDCGSAGLLAVKRHHGVSVVQEPSDAICPSMPMNALSTAEVDYVAPVAQLSSLLVKLVSEELRMPDSVPPSDQEEAEADRSPPPGEREIRHYACPGCGGALEPMSGGTEEQFRCHIGHGFSATNLEAAQGQALEAALWTALRALEEQARLARHLAQRASSREYNLMQTRYEEKARAADEQANLIRAALKVGERAD